MTDALQPEPILQATLRDPPWASRATSRLPGTGPVAPDDWLRVDDAYAGQMALRQRLMTSHCDLVHALRPQAMAPARELLDIVLDELDARSDFTVEYNAVTRPDGKIVSVNHDTPLLTLGHLVQQDFCILQRIEGEHVLTGAILCFPASWTLDEKIDRPMTAIHDPVAPYTADIAARVQRLFDMIRPDCPLWRVNLLLYHDAALFQPRRMADRRIKPKASAEFVRSERQCISRLPKTGAIVFAIHTTVTRLSHLSNKMQSALARYLAGHT